MRLEAHIDNLSKGTLEYLKKYDKEVLDSFSLEKLVMLQHSLMKNLVDLNRVQKVLLKRFKNLKDVRIVNKMEQLGINSLVVPNIGTASIVVTEGRLKGNKKIKYCKIT